jgi:D-3-phosphoglycerate dehydrogenase / 2-oxoglutarate reductase
MDTSALGLGEGFDVDYLPEISHAELLKAVPAYDALVVRGRTKVDGEVLDRGTSLKLVARSGTGLDNVDVEHAKSKGVTVVNSPESLVEAVAEHVTLLMLAMSRHLVEADSGTRAGRWEKNQLTGSELKGKTLGIVGLGRIGRRIGEIAKTLGMSLLVYDVIAIPPEVVSSLGCRVVGFDEIFSGSDFITLHVPLTDQTRHMVDGGRLGKMKKTARLINTSRGGVVDEAALAATLSSGGISGAALDVFEKEPPTGAILGAPNVILTPHIGGQTAEAQLEAVSSIGSKLKEFFGRARSA